MYPSSLDGVKSRWGGPWQRNGGQKSFLQLKSTLARSLYQLISAS
jgi:hypothetical protein